MRYSQNIFILMKFLYFVHNFSMNTTALLFVFFSYLNGQEAIYIPYTNIEAHRDIYWPVELFNKSFEG